MKRNQNTPEIATRAASDADSAFAYDVKKQALGPYITQVWGWDEELQQAFHRREFDSTRLQIITRDGHDIGTIEILTNSERILINMFYILPEFQNQGIGSKLVRDILDTAQRQSLRVRLAVLKINPARRFYERHGFRKVEETDTHWKMEWSS